MHLRAASLAIVVCGLMIGTLAAQYAQQPHVHAQSSGRQPSSSQAPSARRESEPKRFSLWDALTGGRNSRDAASQGEYPAHRTTRNQRPSAYSGNRSYVQPRSDASQPQSQTPSSQFRSPTANTGRRPLGTSSRQSRDQSLADAFEPTTNSAREETSGRPIGPTRDSHSHGRALADRPHGNHDHGVPNQPGASRNSQPRQRRGLFNPLLDLFGNRHNPPQRQQVPQSSQARHRRHQVPPPTRRPAPRANSAFGHSPPPKQTEERRSGLMSMLPEMLVNGRPGPMPMMPPSGSPELAPEPEVAESPAGRRGTEVARSPQLASPRVTPQARRQRRAQTHSPTRQRSSQNETALPPKMASAHANSSRLGPSDAELGMTPPAASNDNKPAETSAAENTPPSSLANQPLVRVRDPQRQDNAALKAMAERFNRREQATTKTPKTYEDWLNRGKSLAIEQKFKQAIAAYSKAIELDAYGLEAYGNRALAYREQKMYRESVYDFNIVLRLKPKMAKAYYDRAETYRVAGKLEKAARDYEEAIRLKPDFALAHAQYGTMLMLNGEYEDAVDILDAAIALDESDDLSVYDRGLAYALSGDFYSALQNFEQLSEPKMQDSKWESLLTRLRRSGEPITTVEMPPTGAQQNSEGQAPKSLIAKTTPGVIGDLANDPFFSGGRPRQETVAQNSAPKSGTPQSDQKVVDQTPPTESVAEAQPPTTSSQSTVPETTSSSDVAASPTLASPDNVAKNVADPERTLLQDPNRRSMDETANVTPQPTEPEKKPMRIVLGGGSTTLPRHKRTFVRVTEADPKPVESVVEKVEEDVTLPTKSHIVESPVQEPSTSTTGEVTAETDTDALWAATRRNRAVSRAALRGDGSLFQIITRDESSMNANEASDPFAVIATPSTRIGIGETIHSTEDDREESQDDAQMSVVKSSTDENAATDEVQSLEFDGVLLPDPKSVTTISEVDAAIAKYNDAILRRPRFAPYYVVRAQLWLKQERRTAALTDLRQAVRLDGDSAEAKSAMEKLEREIADDLARQQESLRTANRYGSGWGRRAPRQ